MDQLQLQGFWGPRTASEDWCEPNYVYSPYIAEFWNTLSSVPLVLSGVFGLYYSLKYNYKLRFVVCAILLTFVGVGSIAFHGTLLYAGQVMDELSMVYAVVAFLYLTLEEKPTKKPLRPFLPFLLLLYSIGFTVAYAVVPDYFIFFVGTFILACAVVVVRAGFMWERTTDPRLKRMFVIGVTVYAASFFLLWLPDKLSCEKYRSLNLHAWFHICGSICPWWFVVWMAYNYYTADYACKTGMRYAPDRKTFVPLEKPLQDYVLCIKEIDALHAKKSGETYPSGGKNIGYVAELQWMNLGGFWVFPYLHLTKHQTSD